MAAILKIDISPCLSEKSSDFHEILYIAADCELDERHVIKNEKVALEKLRIGQNVFLGFKMFSPSGSHTILVFLYQLCILYLYGPYE